MESLLFFPFATCLLGYLLLYLQYWLALTSSIHFNCRLFLSCEKSSSSHSLSHSSLNSFSLCALEGWWWHSLPSRELNWVTSHPIELTVKSHGIYVCSTHTELVHKSSTEESFFHLLYNLSTISHGPWLHFVGWWLVEQLSLTSYYCCLQPLLMALENCCEPLWLGSYSGLW